MSSLVPLNANTQSFNIAAVICHILASWSDSPNAFGSKNPVHTALYINMWEDILLDYHDQMVVEFLKYGWQINYSASQSPHSTMCNHPSALAFPYCIRHYIETEFSFRAIAGPFSTNPLHKPLLCSPLQTVPKRGSSKCPVVLDSSFPPTFSVNSGTPLNTYLDCLLNLWLPGIDHLWEFILAKGRGCCVYKKRPSTHSFRSTLKTIICWASHLTIIFILTCGVLLVYGPWPWSVNEQLRGIIYIFTQAGFFTDVDLDDFYGTECPSLADNAFATLESIFDTLGISLFAWKRFTTGLWDGLLGYPRQYQGFYITCSRKTASWIWLFTVKELQSLLSKLSFVTACVHASRIFLSRLSNALCSFSSNVNLNSSRWKCIATWLGGKLFFPFTTVWVIKPADWSFAYFCFTMDACLTHGGATCVDKCRTFPYLDFVLHAASHISALELFTVIVAVKFWATGLQHRRFLVSWDNEVVVTVINSDSTKDPFMQCCLGQLWFTSALHDVDLCVRHIPGGHNTLAYALSRWDNTSSQTRFAQAATAPGISYVFEEITGDFCYFDLVWYFFAFVIVFFGFSSFQLFRHLPFLFSGNSTNVSSLDAFAQCLVHLAFAASTHKNIKSHVNVFTMFCHSVRASPFPVQIDLLIHYVAYLTLSGRMYATIINHISSLKHVNRLLGFRKVWVTHYCFQLVLRGVKHYLGVSPNHKHPITPELLLQVY